MTKIIEPVKAICGEKLQGRNRSMLRALKNPRVIPLASNQNGQIFPQQPHQILCKLCWSIKYLSALTKQTYLHLNHPAWKILTFGVLNEAAFGKVTKLHLKNLLIFPPSMLLYTHNDKIESSLKCTCQSCQPSAALFCCLVMLRGYSSMFSPRGGGVIWIWQNKTVWLTQQNQTDVTVWSKTHRLAEAADSLRLSFCFCSTQLPSRSWSHGSPKAVGTALRQQQFGALRISTCSTCCSHTHN